MLLVSLGMDLRGLERELVSLLLGELNGAVFTPASIQRGRSPNAYAVPRAHSGGPTLTTTAAATWPCVAGFDLLLERAEDLQVDTPQLIDLLGRFLARAVADEALPPKYLSTLLADPALSRTASAAVEQAHVLLTMKHGLARLSEIWGSGGGRRPVLQLGRKMHLILEVPPTAPRP